MSYSKGKSTSAPQTPQLDLRGLLLRGRKGGEMGKRAKNKERGWRGRRMGIAYPYFWF